MYVRTAEIFGCIARIRKIELKRIHQSYYRRCEFRSLSLSSTWLLQTWLCVYDFAVWIPYSDFLSGTLDWTPFCFRMPFNTNFSLSFSCVNFDQWILCAKFLALIRNQLNVLEYGEHILGTRKIVWKIRCFSCVPQTFFLMPQSLQMWYCQHNSTEPFLFAINSIIAIYHMH